MIPGKWARFYERYVKRPLAIAFLGQRAKSRKQIKGSAGLELVDWRPKGSSDKACLKVLRAEDVRRVGAGPSTERDDEAGTGGDDGAGTGGDDGAGTGKDDKLGTGGPDDEPSTGGPDDKLGIGGPDNERAAEPVARAFRTGARRLSRRAFLLASRSNTFLAFSSSKFVIGPMLPSGSSIANSGLSVTSTNRGTLFLR